MSIKFIFNSNNAEKLLTNWLIKNCSIKNKTTYIFVFEMDLLIFQNPCEFFQLFLRFESTVLENKFRL